jgi:hypothetical protein
LAGSTLSISQTASAQNDFGVTTLAASIFDITFGPAFYGYYHYGHYGHYPKNGYPLIYRPDGYNAYRPYGQRHGYPSYGYGYGPLPGTL